MWLEAEKGPVGREGEAVGSREELGSGRALGMAERRGLEQAEQNHPSGCLCERSMIPNRAWLQCVTETRYSADTERESASAAAASFK